ncbi:MAG: alpha/beta hydrolase [Acidimicrobiales bacterium]
MAMPKYTPVPYDAELDEPYKKWLVENPMRATPTLATLGDMRDRLAGWSPPIAELIDGKPIEHEERLIPGQSGSPDLAITILRHKNLKEGAPGIYHIHGGGLVSGTRFMPAPQMVQHVLEFGFVAISVEYRLAPENPGEGPARDCYAGLVWMAHHAEELGFDPDRLFVTGGSAGGHLTAAVCLLARDVGRPKVFAQLLDVPMLDDRNETPSSYQYDGFGIWDRQTNLFAWECVLGEERGGPEVSPYAAPARAKDLSKLPPAYIGVGSAEVFRDEAVEFASKIWAAGGECELHVWNGAFHAYSMVAQNTKLAEASSAARTAWMRRMLAR